MLLSIIPSKIVAQTKDSNLTYIDSLCKVASQKKFTNFPEAINDMRNAIISAVKSKNNISIFNTYRKLGLIYEDNSRLPEASIEYSKALMIGEQLSPSQQLEIYVDWAIINKKLSNFKISKDYYERTLALAEKTEDIEMIEYAYSGLGNLLKAAGEYDKAVEYHLKSAEIANQRGKKVGVIKSMVNMSETYLISNNYQLALKSIEKAYLMAQEINDSSRISSALNTYGKILNAQGDLAKALTKHQNALSIYQSTSDKKHIAETLIFLADVYAEMKEYDKAELHFKKCTDFLGYLEYYEHPNFYYKFGKLYRNKNQNKDAIYYLEKSIELATKKGFKDLLKKSHAELSEVYNLVGDYGKAYSLLKKANMFGDSLFNESKTKSLAEAQFKFDVEKSEKEIQAIKARQGAYWLIASILLLILATGVFTYVIKLKNKNTFVLLQKNQEIQFQNSKLEKSNEILRQFAYASAHDLKEPLRSISSFVFIIQKKYIKNLPVEAEEYMNFVISGVKRMEQLLSALLEYSTVASDEQKVHKATSLNSILNDVKDNLHTTIKSKNANVYSEGDLPTIWVSQLHLIQLFQNIISNALKFTDRPPVIKVWSETNDSQIILHIKDNGIGMKKEYSDKIFRLFQRLSRSAQYEGTGIGLAICKHIVDKYDGNIWFDSIEGEGTSFHISFPKSLVEVQNDTVQNVSDIKQDKPLLKSFN